MNMGREFYGLLEQIVHADAPKAVKMAALERVLAEGRHILAIVQAASLMLEGWQQADEQLDRHQRPPGATLA